MTISVNTEITDRAARPARGWIFFDSGCAFCRRWVRRVKPVLAPRGFAFAPLEAARSRSRLGIRPEQLLDEVRVLLPDGRAYGGADAMVALARYVWWAWPLVAAAHLPGFRRVLRFAYGRVALRRHCLEGTCAVGSVRAKHGERTAEVEQGERPR
jgi:predicted DCC family thiol-disulfide oxidoreductase YuxK